MGGLLNRFKSMSGIYRLGFDPESMAGVTIPFVIVIGVGAVGWVLIRNVL